MDLTAQEKLNLWEFFPEGVVAIDLETTGLSPLVDRVIEVAAIKVSPQKTDFFATLIDPEVPIPPHTTAIHHITDQMVKGSPTFLQTLEELQSFFSDLPIIAHNAKFDLGFIVMGLQKANMKLATNDIYCSCKLARHTHTEMINHKLSTLVKELNIPLLNHHRALDDAFASLKIFSNSLEKLSAPLSINRPALKRHGYLFSLGDFDKVKTEEFPENLKILEKLVKEAAVVEIYYAGGSHKNTFRPIKLTSLLNTPDGNILYARCLWSDMQKSFKLKKIKNLRLPKAEEIQHWLKK